MNLVDTSGWIEYFFSGENVSFFAKPIEDTAELIVPVVCLYEVFKKVNQVADEARALKAIAHMKQGRIIELSEEIALRVALVSLKYKLPMADSFVYATGLMEGAEIWTQDADFKKPSWSQIQRSPNQQSSLIRYVAQE
jgi:predicted nucleic acid-binding protein